MVTVDVGSAARERQRTWVLGGALLVASPVAALASTGALLALVRAVDPLFALGVLVLVVGIGRAGSVTARRPLGTGAAIGLVVVMLTQPLVAAVVDPPQYQMPLSNSVPPLQLVVPVTLSVKLMLALIAAIQIGRVGVVPRPWNWTPLWVLCAVAIMTAVPMSPFWTPLMGSGANIAPLMVVFDAFGLARQAAVAFLGIVAIVLGSRSGTGSVPVYSSAAP